MSDTGEAILRAYVSGYYETPTCHVDGEMPREKCPCSGCRLYRVAKAFLGTLKCDVERDPGFRKLWEDAK